MPASPTISISLLSTTTPVAGAGFSFTALLNSGTWTNGQSKTTPLSITGISGCFITGQIVSSNQSCCCVVYPGNSAGTLTVTDTVNGGTATITVAATHQLRPRTGVKRYVLGGLRNPAAPRGLITGTLAAQVIYYQLVACNGSLKTCGSVPMAVSSGSPANPISYLYAQRVLTITNAPTTLNGSNYVTLSWPAVTGATGYDILKSSDGVTWVSLALNSNVLTLADTGQSTSAYTLPTTNNTALGSDSNTGLATDAAHALKTAAQAAVVSMAGDEIHIIGCVTDTVQVVFPAVVNLTGDDETTSVLFNTLSASAQNACYILPSSADVSDLSFENEQYVQQVIGYGAGDTAPAIIDCNVYRCDIRGFTKAFTTNATVNGHGFTFFDCMINSVHGCFGTVPPGGGVTLTVASCINLIRCKTFAMGAPLLSGNASISLQPSEGFIFARDSSFFSDLDSQDTTGWRAVGCSVSPANLNICGLILINSRVFGRTLDFDTSAANTATYFSLWQQGTSPIDPVKNSAMLAIVTPTPTSLNTYLSDPTVVTSSTGFVAGVSNGSTGSHMSYANAVNVINGGGSVMFAGTTYTKVANLPSADVMAQYYAQFDANAANVATAQSALDSATNQLNAMIAVQTAGMGRSGEQ